MPAVPAQADAPGPTSHDALRAGEELVRVRAGAFRLLVPLRHVERVLPAALPAARPSPSAEGPVVALPGALVPLVFAAALLGAGEARLAPEHQMVLLGGAAGRALLWVDGVEDVVFHAAAPEGPAGPLVAGWSDPALPTAVLDVPRLLSLALSTGKEP
jgi:hypothetical protein